MSIVPNGKRRLMVAQAAPNPTAEAAGGLDLSGVESGQTQFTDSPVQQEQPEQPLNEPGTDPPVDAPVDQAGEMQNQVAEGQAAEQSGGQDGDIRKTIFDFLVGLGYPPRRLMEFKSQFVQESGSANTGTQVTLVLPDEVYGKNVQIPRDKLKELVQLVEQKHGLSFQDYKRANEQLTLNFITVDAAAAASLEDAGPGDILDKVYGKPSGKGGGKGRPVRAYTIREMIKESKDRQVNMLRTVLASGEKHDSTSR